MVAYNYNVLHKSYNFFSLFFSAVRRNKSFSAGERPKVSKRAPLLNTLPPFQQEAEQEDQNLLSPKMTSQKQPKGVNLKRRGTFHTLDIAKKEGIMSRRQGVKTSVVEGMCQIFILFFLILDFLGRGGPYIVSHFYLGTKVHIWYVNGITLKTST